MNIQSISGVYTEKLLTWRNENIEGAGVRAITEVGVGLLSVCAVVESVAFSILSGGAWLAGSEQFEFFEGRVMSAAFTFKWLLHTVFSNVFPEQVYATEKEAYEALKWDDPDRKLKNVIAAANAVAREAERQVDEAEALGQEIDLRLDAIS